MGYYCRFVDKFADKFAEISTFLTPATHLASPHKVKWTSEMDTTFWKLHKSVYNRIVLTVPCESSIFLGVGIVAGLHEQSDRSEVPRIDT